MLTEGHCSQKDRVDSGVTKGTVFAPLLFLCFINDLLSLLDPDAAVRLFADDCLVHSSIINIKNQAQLQRDLDSLSLWGRYWA